MAAARGGETRNGAGVRDDSTSPAIDAVHGPSDAPDASDTGRDADRPRASHDLSAATNGSLFEDIATVSETPRVSAARFSLSREALKQLRAAARHAEPRRWAFLYRVIWRYAHGDHSAVLPGDVDGARLVRLVRDVSREYHHWRAFMRFQEARGPDQAPVLMAWFTPEHDILEPLADYFEKRLGRAHWIIASPCGLARHDGQSVAFDWTPRLPPPQQDDDAEALWRTYYRSIFNPARVNLALTRQHLPARYWKHLPEGDLIPQLAAAATTGQQRHGQAGALRGAHGRIIPVSADAAQPQRDTPHDLDACRRCALWEHATQAVSGSGPTQAALMLVGEQPGDQEDLAGRPFVGPAGQLLDRALQRAGIARDTVYLTNAVKHFKWTPRGKRRLHKTPVQREVEACHHWLEQEIAANQPRVVVALGATALASLAGSRLSLSKILNTPFELDGLWIVPTYHPSYVLRAPDADVRDKAENALTEALAIALTLSQKTPIPEAQ